MGIQQIQQTHFILFQIGSINASRATIKNQIGWLRNETPKVHGEGFFFHFCKAFYCKKLYLTSQCLPSFWRNLTFFWRTWPPIRHASQSSSTFDYIKLMFKSYYYWSMIIFIWKQSLFENWVLWLLDVDRSLPSEKTGKRRELTIAPGIRAVTLAHLKKELINGKKFIEGINQWRN